MSYTNEDLHKMQSWSLERKIRVTQTRIIEWYEHFNGKTSVSFSGGLDSTVLLDLARRAYPDIEAVFVNTTMEFPEILQFVKTFENVKILTPAMNYGQVVKKYGYPVISKEQADLIHRMQSNEACKKAYMDRFHEKPLEWIRRNFHTIPLTFFKCLFGLSKKRAQHFIETGELPKSKYAISKKWQYLIDAPFPIHNACCDILKKGPIKKYQKLTGKNTIVGTTAEESILRKQVWLKNGCNSFDSKEPKSQPMSFWTHQDVLKYIKTVGIPYASIYGSIEEDKNGRLYTTKYQRTGCMGCLFGCHLEKGTNRLQMLKTTHPKVYKYLFEKLDYAKVCDFIGIPYDNKEVISMAHNYTRQRQGRDFPADNYLKNAEMSVECNYNNIDGIINGSQKADEEKKSFLERLETYKSETERNAIPVDGREPGERGRC